MNKLKCIRWSQPSALQVVQRIPKEATWALASFTSVLLVGGSLAFTGPLRDPDLGSAQPLAHRKAIVASTLGPQIHPSLSRWTSLPKQAQQTAKTGTTIATANSAKSSNSKSSNATATQSDQKTSTAQPATQNTSAASTPTASAPAVPPPYPGSGLTIDAVLEMRVAVAKNAGSLSIATSTPGFIVDGEGRVLRELPAQNSYITQPGGQGIAFGDWQIPTAVWVEPSQGGAVYVGDRWYRGRVLLVQREEGLLAVNHVLLKDYLYSVVGGEVSPSWPMAALKAQAIAARSYALTHNIRPANSLYDLDNTPRFQAYGGIAKEASTTYEAVDGTSGEFISYQGGIVESLYAASDHIVATVHGGAGMSQLGALDLAEQGYSYSQILSNYYPGTTLARLELDQE